MPVLVYVLFSSKNDRDPVGVYSSRELAERQAKALNLTGWFTLTREYI